MVGVGRGGGEAIGDGSAQWLRRLLKRRRSQPGHTTNSTTQLKPRAPSPGTPGRAKAGRHGVWRDKQYPENLRKLGPP